MQGLLGRKVGMTQVYGEDGTLRAATVLEVGPCVAVQLKSRSRDGYEAVQVGFMEQKASRLTKSLQKRFENAKATPCRYLREFRLDRGETVAPGAVLTAEVFTGVPFVDVQGWTKGRGFQGVVKRHRMSGGPAAHGSGTHRRGGSIGCRAVPGNVHRGKRMPGHMGNVRITVQNLRVLRVMPEDNLLVVGGAVMGPVGGVVSVTKALKRKAPVKSS